MTHEARTFRDEALDYACRMARLDLPPERRPTLGGAMEGIYALIDRLDGVDLGETPPATAFDPRWR